jgi:D-glycerate 3-kinase
MGRLREEGEVEIPVFDKGIDDRVGTRTLRGPVDIVVLEGWCVGAWPAPAAQLEMPINALEHEEDECGDWRRYVNEALAGRYRALWDTLDTLIFLRVPGLDSARRWRLEQEEARPPALRMDAEAVDRFVQHFERITSAMWAAMPERADLVVELDQAHRIARLSGLATA